MTHLPILQNCMPRRRGHIYCVSIHVGNHVQSSIRGVPLGCWYCSRGTASLFHGEGFPAFGSRAWRFWRHQRVRGPKKARRQVEPVWARQISDGKVCRESWISRNSSVCKRKYQRQISNISNITWPYLLQIPNPLFDLAGITCGHFLVPFWTFFGATLIGKAIVKMHIQKIFVIIAFNEILVEKAVDFMALVPVIGKKLQMPFKAFLQNQKDRLHRGTSKVAHSSPNIIQNLFEYFVIFMVLFFVSSIFNSLAQSYQKKLNSQKKNKRS